MADYEFEEIVAEEFPETWSPKPEDDITGQVKELRTVDVDGREAHAAIIDTGEGEFTVWLNRVLMSRFNKAGVVIGDVVRVVYAGRVKSRTSEFYYKNYRLYVAKREA